MNDMNKHRIIFTLTLLGLALVWQVGCTALPFFAPTPTPEPTAIPAPTPIPEPTLPAQVGPKVPHTTEGRGDCLACHLSMWPMPP